MMLKNTPFYFTFIFLTVLLLPLFPAMPQPVPANGPEGIAVTALCVHKERLFLSTAKSVYLSTDNGASWHNINHLSPEGIFGGGEVNQIYSHKDILYMATSQGLYISRNGGDQWVHPQGSKTISMYGVAVSDSGIFAGVYVNGVMFSKDGGNTWQKRTNGMTNENNYIQNILIEGNTIVAGTDSWGIYTSENNGLSWTHTYNLANYGHPAQSIKMLYNDGNRFYAGTGNGLLISADRGRSWQAGNSGFPDQTTVYSMVKADTMLHFATSNGLYSGGIKEMVWRKNQGLTGYLFQRLAYTGKELYAVSDVFYQSTDKGITWNRKGSGLYEQDIKRLLILPDKLWATSFSRHWTTSNGGSTWNSLPLPQQLNYGLDIALCGDSILSSSGDLSLHYSEDAGLSWNKIPIDIFTGYITRIAVKGNYIFLGTLKGPGIMVSPDRGKSWKVFNTGMSATDDSQFAFNGDTVYCMSAGGVHKAAVGGMSWIPVNVNLGKDPTGSIAVHQGKLFVSGTNGVSSAKLQSSLWSEPSTFNNVTKLYSYKSYLFAAAGNQLFATTDTGRTWAAMFPAQKNLKIYDMVVHEDILYLGTNYSVYKWRLSELNVINGKVFFDANGNTRLDAGEAGRAGITGVETETGNLFTSNEQGDFSVYAGTGTMHLTLPYIPRYYSMNGPDPSVSFSNVGSSANALFPLLRSANVQDYKVNITPLTPARPGFKVAYDVTVENAGTITGNSHIRLYTDPLLYLDSISRPYTSQSTYKEVERLNMMPGHKEKVVMYYTLSASASINSRLALKATVNEGLADNFAEDNTDTLWQIVQGSYDPNDIVVDKTALPVSSVPESPYLEYTIRFQNTGSDTAFTVVLKDPLPDNVLPATMEVIAASHPFELKWQRNYIAQFIFSNILLPDSNTNTVKSNGYVKYKVRVRPDARAVVRNAADIYFDFNAPVATNIAETHFVNPTALENWNISDAKIIYPNPSHDNFFMVGNSVSVTNMEVTDVHGRIWITKQFYQSEMHESKLVRHHLPTGIYFVKLNYGNDYSKVEVLMVN